MGTANGNARRKDPPRGIRISGRSFLLASDLPREELLPVERAIQALGGTIHPFLSAITDVLVVGRAEGTSSGARWAQEQIRRGSYYLDRWGHLEVISESELRAVLDLKPGPFGVG